MKPTDKDRERAEKLLESLFECDRSQLGSNDFDANFRHGKAKPYDYLLHFLKLCRPHAYATQDDTWGELEKLLSIILRNYNCIKLFGKNKLAQAIADEREECAKVAEEIETGYRQGLYSLGIAKAIRERGHE